MIRRLGLASGALFAIALAFACHDAVPADEVGRLDADNPLRPIPKAPLGLALDLSRLPIPPTPSRVRLGRWLFFDTRLSADASISCSTCHDSRYAFSQRSPVSTGIGGRRGRPRKALPILNLGVPPYSVNFRKTPRSFLFWDGRAASLESQALMPIADRNEMGNSHEAMVATIAGIHGYERYFAEAFGTPRVTKERIAQAIADYERTRMSGNSPFDRWRAGGEPSAVSDEAKRGYQLFSGGAECSHCHGLDGRADGFHNTGIGWDPRTRTFADLGRYAVTKGTDLEDWPGTFKAPTLRETSKHPPYMHDGSIATLREVVEFYNRGGNPNPDLSTRMHPLHLTPADVSAIVTFLESLEGEGWQDTGPHVFPR